MSKKLYVVFSLQEELVTTKGESISTLNNNQGVVGVFPVVKTMKDVRKHFKGCQCAKLEVTPKRKD